MLRDNLVGLIEPMQISAGADPLALSIQKQASDDRSLCLENPRPEGVESSLTENVTSPFQAEPTHFFFLLSSARGAFIPARSSLGPELRRGLEMGDMLSLCSKQANCHKYQEDQKVLFLRLGLS